MEGKYFLEGMTFTTRCTKLGRYRVLLDLARENRLDPTLAGVDANGLFHGVDEDLTIAHLPFLTGTGGRQDDIGNRIDAFVS